MAKFLLQLVVVCAAFWRIDAIRPLQTVNLLPNILGQIACGANEMFSHCGNDGCQRSCSRLDVSNCIPTCSVPGCICAGGYVRSGNGVCVLPTSCPTQTCGTNEVFSPCGNDGCRPTCIRRDTTGCNSVCSTPACVCGTGYVRNDFGNCVTREQCPTITCPANEVFSNCGNDGCQRTCTRPIVGVCNRVCTVSGCICAPDFFRNEITGQCVSSCPNSPCTGQNEVFSLTGDTGCLLTCARRDASNCIPVPSNPRCICAPTFVLSPTGTCINPNMCPANVCTNPNEIFTNTGNNICQPICLVSIAGCVGEQRAGCICGPGFERNYLGMCVVPGQCMTCTNPLTEIFLTCGVNACEGTCATPNPICDTTGACRARCFCRSPLVRGSGGQCINVNACP